MTHRASVPAVTTRFETVDGKVVEQTFTGPFTIGRAAGCQVQVDVKSVSRLHARVVVEQGQWCVRDAGSTNGLYVEGQRRQQVDLDGPVTLRLGPSGPVLRLSVTYPEPETPKQEPAAHVFFEPEAPVRAPRAPAPLIEAASTEPSPGETLGTGGPGVVLPSPAPYAAPRHEPAVQAPLQEPDAAPPKPYRANRFTFPPLENWTDETVHILQGPVTDSFQHSLTIQVEPEARADALRDYADGQMQALQAALTGCRLLKTDLIRLVSGLPAYRAIFVWYPAEGLRLYQEQLYVLHQRTGYTLTATFTSKTRKTLGPLVEQIMVGFTPRE